MITIILINCKSYLLAIGIDMELRGSGELFTEKLTEKLPDYQGWEYNFSEEKLIIWINEGTEIPDMSEFGELVTNAENL